MTISTLELHVMQLTHFFVTKKGYQSVQIKGMEHEVWLFHDKPQTYPFIRIVQGTYKEEDVATIHQVQEALHKILRIKGTVFNIQLDVKSYDLDLENEIKTIGIDTQSYQKLVIDRYFPETKQLFMPTLDIVEDYQKYKTELEATLKRRQQKHVISTILRSMPWVSVAFTVVCVLIWIGVMFLARQYGNDSQIPASIALGAYYRMFLVSNQEYWRFLTAGFVHIDFIHLLMNVLSLINVGVVVEKFYGRWKYAVILLGSITMATVFAHFNSATVVVMGISGGVYGAFAALLVILFHTKAIRNPRIMRSIGNVIIINILINFLPSVSQVGHLGGFIGGLVLAILFIPGKEGLALRRNMAIASLLLVVFVGFQLSRSKPRFDLYGGTDAKVIEMYHNAGLKKYAMNLYRGVHRIYAEEVK